MNILELVFAAIAIMGAITVVGVLLLAVWMLIASPKVLTCTRPLPHECTKNGPCNGWPR